MEETEREIPSTTICHPLLLRPLKFLLVSFFWSLPVIFSSSGVFPPMRGRFRFAFTVNTFLMGLFFSFQVYCIMIFLCLLLTSDYFLCYFVALALNSFFRLFLSHSKVLYIPFSPSKNRG